MRRTAFMLPPDIKRRLPKIQRKIGELLKGNAIKTSQGMVEPALRLVETDIKFARPANYNRKIVKPTYRKELTGVPSVEFVFADKALLKAVELGMTLRLDGVGFKLAMTLEDEPRMFFGFGKKPYLPIADMEDLKARVRMLFSRAVAKNYKALEGLLEEDPQAATSYFQAVNADPEINATDLDGDEDDVPGVMEAPSAEGIIPDPWISFFDKTVGKSYVLTTAALQPLRVKVVSFVGTILTLEALEDFTSRTAGKKGDRFQIDLAEAPMTLTVEQVFQAVMQAALKNLYQVHGRTKIKGITLDAGSSSAQHPADPQVDFTSKTVQEEAAKVAPVEAPRKVTFESLTGLQQRIRFLDKLGELLQKKYVRDNGKLALIGLEDHLHEPSPEKIAWQVDVYGSDLVREQTVTMLLDASSGDKVVVSDTETGTFKSFPIGDTRAIGDYVLSQIRIAIMSAAERGVSKVKPAPVETAPTGKRISEQEAYLIRGMWSDEVSGNYYLDPSGTSVTYTLTSPSPYAQEYLEEGFNKGPYYLGRTYDFRIEGANVIVTYKGAQKMAPAAPKYDFTVALEDEDYMLGVLHVLAEDVQEGIAEVVELAENNGTLSPGTWNVLSHNLETTYDVTSLSPDSVSMKIGVGNWLSNMYSFAIPEVNLVMEMTLQKDGEVAVAVRDTAGIAESLTISWKDLLRGDNLLDRLSYVFNKIGRQKGGEMVSLILSEKAKQEAAAAALAAKKPKAPKAPKQPKEKALPAKDRKAAELRASDFADYLMSSDFESDSHNWKFKTSLYYYKHRDGKFMRTPGRYGPQEQYSVKTDIRDVRSVRQEGYIVRFQIIPTGGGEKEAVVDMSRVPTSTKNVDIVRSVMKELYMPYLQKEAEENAQSSGATLYVRGDIEGQEKKVFAALVQRLKAESAGTKPAPEMKLTAEVRGLVLMISWAGKSVRVYANNSFQIERPNRIMFVGEEYKKYTLDKPEQYMVGYTQEELDKQLRDVYPGVIDDVVAMVKDSAVGAAFNGAGIPENQTVSKSDVIQAVKSVLSGGKLIYESEDMLEFDHYNRQRLDHYGNDGDGWDSDAWYEDYAGPLSDEVTEALKPLGGSKLFAVDIGEKGHVNVQIKSGRGVFASGKGVRVAHNLYYRLTEKLEEKGIRYEESSRGQAKVIKFDGNVIEIAPNNREWALLLKGYRQPMKNLDVDDLDFYV